MGRRYVLPPLLEDQILAALAKLGLTEASVTLAEITPTSASLENLSIDPENRFGIDKIKVRYSLGSLRQGRVNSIVLQGIDAEIRIENGEVDVGPLAGLAGGDSTTAGDPIELPFDRVELEDARLRLRIQDEDILVPVNAVLERDGKSLIVDLNALLDATEIRIGGHVNPGGEEADLQITTQKLEAARVHDIVVAFAPADSVAVSGRLRFDCHATMHGGEWSARLVIEDDEFALSYPLPDASVAVVVRGLEGDVSYSFADGVAWNIRTKMSHAPCSLRGTLDPVSQDGHCDIEISPIGTKTLRQFTYALPDSQLGFDGSMSLTARVDAKGGLVRAKASIDCTSLTTTVGVDGHPLTIDDAILNANVTAKRDSAGLKDVGGALAVQHARLAGDFWKLSVPAVDAELPFSLDSETITGGTLSVDSVIVEGHSIRAIAAEISMVERNVVFSATASALPEAVAEITGTIDMTTSPPAGKLDVAVPKFTLQNGKALVEQFSELNTKDVGGDFAINAHFGFQGDEIAQRVDVEITNGFWEAATAEGRVDSISGAFTLQNLAPVVSAGPQDVRFGSAAFGSFKGSNGSATFELRENETVFVSAVQCDWLDGGIHSDSILINPLKTSMSCNVFVDSLDLQGILDFVDYKGVRGHGRIFGNLPVALTWGSATTVTFGEGALEARPRIGRLQLTKETAMTILGLTVELDPATASNAEMAKALTLKALQDMEYSELSITFQNAGGDLVTRVLIKGHGPVGDPDNRVPIGGIDINISNLDDLLNNIILPGLETKKMKLGG